MRLSGPLPPQWSAMTALQALWLGEHSLTGTLPKEWSALEKLKFMSIKSNLLTGTVPPEWSSLQMSTLYASGNWLEGSLPHCWDDRDDRVPKGFLDFKVNYFSAAPESYRDADNKYNCMAMEDCQRMCPSPWRSVLMAAVLILSLVGVLILEAAARGWEVPLSDLRFAMHRLAKTPLKMHFTKSNMLLMAALNALCQRLFILSPAFSAVERAFIARTSGYLGVAGRETARLLAATVCSMLPIVATLLIVAGFLGLSVLVSLPRLELLPKKLAMQAWTLVASEDILRDNLQTLKIDQLLLLGMFLVCSLVVPLVVFLGLPEVIAIREVDPSVFWGVNSTEVQLMIYLPRSMMALLAASYISVIYGMVAALLIPGAVMWPSVAVNDAIRATGAAPRVQQSLRQLRRLRWAVPQALLSLLLCATCMALFSATEWREVDDYGDNESGLSTVWGSNIEAGVISTLVGFQVICAIGWNLAVWGINRTSPVTDVVAVTPADEEAAPSDVANGSKEAISFCPVSSCKSTAAWAASSAATPTRASSCRPAGLSPGANSRSSSARGPGRWLPEVSMVGQARARDNALLLVTVLQMLHVDDARAGPVVAGMTWLASIAILCWALLVGDAPMRFDDIHECAAFGMVVVASDLAAILKADLAADDNDYSSAGAPPYPHRVNLVDSQATSSSSEEEDCCADYPAGCPRCQLLLRRVPATLYRMKETLCISYRWQSQVRAVVRPPGHGPVAPASGLRNRVAGINMTRWQREQLLAAILRSSCTYVWLDVLSIPTALEPPEGTRLWELSEMLMARMMAVYATAVCTLALLSNETEGERYCQRAWTLQEYCVARRLDVVCQSSTSSEAALVRKNRLSFRKVLAGISMTQLIGRSDKARAFAGEEVARYQELRKYVRQSMSKAVPLWIRLLRGQSMAIDEVDERATLYAKVVGTVNCQEQVDLVRALTPVLFNTSVQTMEELRVLVRESSRAMPEGSAGSEAMKSAESLLGIEDAVHVDAR